MLTTPIGELDFSLFNYILFCIYIFCCYLFGKHFLREIVIKMLKYFYPFEKGCIKKQIFNDNLLHTMKHNLYKSKFFKLNNFGDQLEKLTGVLTAINNWEMKQLLNFINMDIRNQKELNDMEEIENMKMYSIRRYRLDFFIMCMLKLLKYSKNKDINMYWTIYVMYLHSHAFDNLFLEPIDIRDIIAQKTMYDKMNIFFGFLNLLQMKKQFLDNDGIKFMHDQYKLLQDNRDQFLRDIKDANTKYGFHAGVYFQHYYILMNAICIYFYVSNKIK